MYFLAKKLKMARLVRHSLDEIFSEFWSYFGDPPDDPVGRESWAGNQGPRDRLKPTFFVAWTDMLYDEKDSFPQALFKILFAYASKGPAHLIKDPDYKWLLGEIEGLRDSIIKFGANNKDQLRTCKECKVGSSISFQDQDYTLYLRDECWRCPKCRAVNKLEEPSREDTSGKRKVLGQPVEEPPRQAQRRQRASSTASFYPSETEDVSVGEGLNFQLRNHRGASSA
ncbi:uncharacterized protein J3D65DRAFT_623635 [Phyllosticta citribraziliensis]|uniref:Uncharacterized protein n=1 Tax=Phyllosticta citribraziliensis TaxID=989973 RepID=A0ABR1LQ53_9PEZI